MVWGAAVSAETRKVEPATTVAGGAVPAVAPVPAPARSKRSFGAAFGSFVRRSFRTLDFYKATFSLFGAVIAGAWTAHLYLEDDWKRTNEAVLEMTSALHEMSSFCSKKFGALNAEKLAVILDATSDKKQPSTAEGRCFLAMYRGRLVVARTATQVAKPLGADSAEWTRRWRSLNDRMKSIAEEGMKDKDMAQLKTDWAWILDRVGIGNIPQD